MKSESVARTSEDFGRKPEGDRGPAKAPVRSANSTSRKAGTDEGEAEKNKSKVLHGLSFVYLKSPEQHQDYYDY